MDPKSLFCCIRIRILQSEAQQIIVNGITARVLLYMLLKDIGHQRRILLESIVTENGVFQRHILRQLTPGLIRRVHEVGMHSMVGFIGLCAAIKVHLGQCGLCVLNALVHSLEEKSLGLGKALAAGVHQRQPSAITIGGIGVCPAGSLEFFYHLQRKALGAPSGKEMLQEFAVVGDVKCLIHGYS